MTALRRRLLADLPRRGRAPKPHPCEVAAVHQRTRHDGRAPDPLSDAARRQDCLCWLHEKTVAASTCRMHL
jgi:hypothetical protein